MNTAPLVPSLETIAYEIQFVRSKIDVLVSEFTITVSRLDRMEKEQDKHHTILITGNGEPSLREQMRTLNTKLDSYDNKLDSYNKKLDDLIEDIKTEREIRKKAEEADREKLEGFRQKIFLSVFGLVLSGAAWLIINTVIHILQASQP